jgi:hypothetical protein
VVTLWLTALGSVALASGSEGSLTTTYRWVDAQGVVHFSDTPQPGAQRVQIAPAQTYQSSTAPATGAARPAETADDSHRLCSISQPQAEQSFYAPDSVEVAVELNPPLQPGDRVSVTLDGHPLDAKEQAQLSYRIETPDRGAHTLAVSVRDAQGNVVCSSAGVTFYVQRPSLLSPQSPARGH